MATTLVIVDGSAHA